MKIDATEKYAEFKQFMEEDLEGVYNHVKEVKEYVDSIPVKK